MYPAVTYKDGREVCLILVILLKRCKVQVGTIDMLVEVQSCDVFLRLQHMGKVENSEGLEELSNPTYLLFEVTSDERDGLGRV